tara:strand:- start:608 stop:1150 length:543 start_codon:yes stop_codon:yes gene_type:complete
MNNKTSYRILKLINGENIIGEIAESTNKTLSVYRPFEMKVITVSESDESMLFQSEVLLMRNWLGLANEIKSTILKNHILSISTPKSSIIECYEDEKKKEDEPNSIKDIKESLKDDEKEFEFRINPKDIQKLLDDIIKSKDIPLLDEEYNEIEEDHEDFEEHNKNIKEYEGQDTDDDMFGY